MTIRFMSNFSNALKKTMHNLPNKNQIISAACNNLKPKSDKLLGAAESHKNPTSINKLDKNNDEYKKELIRIFKYSY